ncbi:MAG: hypothetical protein IJI21_01385, partial [Clostridia bacterium]|nr:hypothetical protein [Clostridia bacterium]
MKATRLLMLLLALTLLLPAGSVAEAAGDPLALPVFTQTECEWDDAGRLISETAYDAEGNPAVNRRGFHRAEYAYDEAGNLLSEAFFGLQDEPVVSTAGYASRVLAYEGSDRHLVSEDKYAADGSRAEIPGGYSFRRDTWQDGLIRATEFFNAAGDSVQPTGGYARILYEVQEDENALIITKSYLSAEGKPLIGTEGGASVVSTYAKGVTAAANATVENMGLGMKLPTGDKTHEVGAYAATTGKAENRDLRLLSAEIFGLEGQGTLGASHWHRQVNAYDDRGNLIRTDFQAADGSPILAANGYASMVNTYDDQNRVIEIDYLDREGALVKMINGYAKVTYEYDGSRVHFTRYFGADGERTMISNGYSMMEEEYDGGDEYDYRVTYYDILDRITMANSGRAREDWKFDGSWVTDTDGNRNWVLNPDRIRWMKFFGTDLELIRITAGYAGVENERNENGQVIRTTYRDENWEPVRNDEMQYAWIEFAYEDGAPVDAPAVHEAYFDETGAPCEGLNGAYARS